MAFRLAAFFAGLALPVKPAGLVTGGGTGRMKVGGIWPYRALRVLSCTRLLIADTIAPKISLIIESSLDLAKMGKIGVIGVKSILGGQAALRARR